MDWKVLIKQLENEMELFLAHLPPKYPASIQASSRTPEALLEALYELERAQCANVDNACRDYARDGKFRTKLSHEELFLLQPRFYVAAVLACVLDTPVKPQGTQRLFEPPSDQCEVLEWLLVSAWHVYGREDWKHREEAIARRISHRP